MFWSCTKDFIEKFHNSLNFFLLTRLNRKYWWVNNLSCIRMAAMHWEARRRQSLLDRRMARDKQQVGLALHPGKCQQLSFLKSYNGAELTAISLAAALLYYWTEQRSLETEQRHRHLSVGSELFPVARSLYPVADFQDLFKHKRGFRLDSLCMVVLFSLLNLINQRYN